MEKIRQSFPTLLDGQSEGSAKLLFVCDCQQFVELIRRGSPDQALEFLQSSLSPFFKDPARFDQAILQDVVALLAYEDPLQSPVRYLLQDQQRSDVADTLNHAILSQHFFLLLSSSSHGYFRSISSSLLRLQSDA